MKRLRSFKTASRSLGVNLALSRRHKSSTTCVGDDDVRAPNILIIMVDQLTGTLFPDGGPPHWLYAPNLKRIAARSTRFANTYTPSPLCAPARASFMSGQLPTGTHVYDNAAEFASSIPTFAHYLRKSGYYVGLSGKMHFVGPDQLHGFEERLTTDIYPADFGWTPDYTRPYERIDWWYHNLSSVTGSGVAEITNQMEYDDEVAFFGVQKIYQLSRSSGLDSQIENCMHPTALPDAHRPWCLTISFTHPHDPYVARRRYWNLYEDCEELTPKTPMIPFEKQDAHSKRLLVAADYKSFPYTLESVRHARRAYFANITYLDDKVGEILGALERTRQLNNTIIIFCSDHGDMLGERGLWFKMNFYEGSLRVPLMISLPQNILFGQNRLHYKVNSAINFFETRVGHTVRTPTSLADVLPTLVDINNCVNDVRDELCADVAGESLLPLIKSQQTHDANKTVLVEYAAEASAAPMICLRRDCYKFTFCELDPPQLFDLRNDPQELHNLATDPQHSNIFKEFIDEMRRRWDLAAFDREVRRSQTRRLAIYASLRNGAHYPWDFQPLQKASERYMRNHMDLNVVEHLQRFPRGE